MLQLSVIVFRRILHIFSGNEDIEKQPRLLHRYFPVNAFFPHTYEASRYIRRLGLCRPAGCPPRRSPGGTGAALIRGVLQIILDNE